MIQLFLLLKICIYFLKLLLLVKSYNIIIISIVKYSYYYEILFSKIGLIIIYNI